jgi:hypothetical protein
MTIYSTYYLNINYNALYIFEPYNVWVKDGLHIQQWSCKFLSHSDILSHSDVVAT